MRTVPAGGAGQAREIPQTVAGVQGQRDILGELRRERHGVRRLQSCWGAPQPPARAIRPWRWLRGLGGRQLPSPAPPRCLHRPPRLGERGADRSRRDLAGHRPRRRRDGADVGHDSVNAMPIASDGTWLATATATGPCGPGSLPGRPAQALRLPAGSRRRVRASDRATGAMGSHHAIRLVQCQ